MLRLLYSFGFACCLPFILIRLLWRSRHNPAYRQRLAERFSFALIKQKKNGIWIHTVSMGEAIAATPLIKAIQQQYPQLPVTVTAMTVTGSEYISHTFTNSVYHCYLPYDVYCMQRRFLKKLSPRLVIILETELWPNLLAACRYYAIPVLLANGRLSARSARGYRLISPITRSMLSSIHVMSVQEDAHKQRFQQLGMPLSTIHVTGSVKFDITVPENVIAQGQQLRQQLGTTRPVWIAASTHEGEEQQLLELHRRLQTHIPTVLLIIVPRHPQRFDKVTQYANDAGYNVIRYSQRQDWTTDAVAAANVVVGDVMGQLLMLYASADAAFVGGSLIKHGGHNPLEPAALKLPIIVGEHMFNFIEITKKLVEGGGMQQVTDLDQLTDTIKQWLITPTLAQQVGERAQQVVLQNRGALQKQLDLVEQLLKDSPSYDRHPAT